MSDQIIEARGIQKFYGQYHALKAVSLSVGAGEFLALVGPSGCGKTSLLKILAGFEAPSDGSLRIAGQDMTGVPASARPTRMVFQKLALFPHKTVAENIGFPLMLAGKSVAEIRASVGAMLEMMHLKESYLNRYPNQLSGGEQQRVALARALVSKPPVLLLDEPMSALDAKLRKSLQAELKHLHRNMGTSFVHVTHDLEEAMMLADRICVMRAGEVVQVGTPADIYYRPADAFVAGFIGETNLLPATFTRSGNAVRFDCPQLRCTHPLLAATQVSETLTDRSGLLMIRPELLRILEPGESADCLISGRVSEFFVRGGSLQYRVTGEGDTTLILDLPGTMALPLGVGDPVRLGCGTADLFAMRG
ncbi:ABC transporter ATP-binding protein [Pseudotabrizicola sp. L79]|uniref:ABC transporter ATP-binding protein n=1 Tax=Pseudotabrizicola sp. L79 TaxID=3118402 RepID=UPI002F943502